MPRLTHNDTDDIAEHIREALRKHSGTAPGLELVEVSTVESRIFSRRRQLIARLSNGAAVRIDITPR